MWDRIVDVFAGYGAAMLILVVMTWKSSQDESIEDPIKSFYPQAIGWTMIIFGFGAVYVLMAPFDVY